MNERRLQGISTKDGSLNDLYRLLAKHKTVVSLGIFHEADCPCVLEQKPMPFCICDAVDVVVHTDEEGEAWPLS